MSRGFSLYLDAVRFLAALIVLLSHFAYSRFSRGDYLVIREYNLGSDAVVLFFVLSGFVIAYCVAEKDRTFQSFAFNRATRIYSVAFPALIFTFLFDRIGAYFSPKGYDGWFYNPLSLWEQLAYGLSFSNEWTSFVTRMGTNGPYWSLSYEVAYYILFGVAVYMTGWQRIALLMAGAIVFGIKILLLMPAWLMGVWLYHALKRSANAPDNPARWWLIAALMVVLYILLQRIEMPERLMLFTINTIGLDLERWLRFSDEFLWNGLIAAMFTVHLFAVGQALRQSAGAWKSARAIRWLAGGSFSLYVVHYPLLQMIDETMTNNMHPLLHDVLLLGLVFGGCYLFAQIFERTLPWQRAMLRTRFSGHRITRPAE